MPTTNEYIRSGGLTRQFLLHIPANLLPQPRVVIHLHGGEGTGKQSLALWKKWEEHGVILIMPYGEAPGKPSRWVAIGNGGSQQRDPIDEDFLLQLPLLAQSRHGAATTMLTGFSSGGGMVHHMHAFHADKFDCFVPMSKGLGRGLLSITPPALRPVRLVFGTADDNYADDGADGTIDAASTFASYLGRIPGASQTRHREAGTATTAITLAYTGAVWMEYARVHPMPHRVPKDELGDPWDGVDQAIRFGSEAAGIQHL